MPGRVGPYVLRDLLGEGGFARVYLADQVVGIRREVAVKLLKRGFDSRDLVARFEAERQLLAMMDHPDIATIFDAGCTMDGQPYFAMEYIPGQAITEYCRGNGLDTRARVRLMARVCRAVQHANGRGAIHRDLKPSNILVAPTEEDGEPVRVKVIDFGVAKAVKELPTDQVVTRDGQFVGTLAYVSPEQVAEGAHSVDVRTDVYSLGAVLFELLTDRTPHLVQDKPMVWAARVIAETDAPALGDYRVDLSGDLEVVLATALARDVDARYGTASELGAELERWLAGEPIVARAPRLGAQLLYLGRRHRVASMSLVAGLLVVLVAFVLVIDSNTRANRESKAMIQQSLLLLEEVIAPLSEVPGTEEYRHRILDALLVPTFERAILRDAELAADYARALVFLGDAIRDRGAGVGGRSAIDAYREAVRVLDAAIVAFPDELSLRADLSIACVKVGDRLGTHGEIDDMMRLYRRALVIDEELVRRKPGNRRYLSNLSWSYERLQVKSAEVSLPEESSAFRRKRFESARRLLEMHPDHPDSRYNMAFARIFESRTALNDRDFELSGAEASKAVQLTTSLTDEHPERRAFRRAHVSALTLRSRASIRVGELLEASAILDDAEKLAAAHVEDDPRSIDALMVLVGVHETRIDLASKQKDLAAERRCREQIIETLFVVRGLDPEHVRSSDKLATYLLRDAERAFDKRQLDDVRGLAERAVVVLEALIQQLPPSYSGYGELGDRLERARRLLDE